MLCLHVSADMKLFLCKFLQSLTCFAEERSDRCRAAAAFALSCRVCTVRVALSFEVVTQHLARKLFSACRVIVFLFFFLCFWIMWLAFCTRLESGLYSVRLLKNELRRFPGSKICSSWKRSFNLTFSFVCTHAPVLCSFQFVVRVPSVKQVIFILASIYLPSSVQAGLQIFTYLCDFCLLIFMDLFSEPL